MDYIMSTQNRLALLFLSVSMLVHCLFAAFSGPKVTP